MSAKHTQTLRARLRTMEADDSRLNQLEFMMGTGFGITRSPQRHSDGSPKYQIITPFQAIHKDVHGHYGRVGVDVFGTTATDIFSPIGTYIRRLHSTTIIAEDAALMTEIDMKHYRALGREKRVLEMKLHKYVPGHSWFIRHISPFGADRFRAFDPTPQAEQIYQYPWDRERWCNRISGY